MTVVRRSVSSVAISRMPCGPTVLRNQATRAPGGPFLAWTARPCRRRGPAREAGRKRHVQRDLLVTGARTVDTSLALTPRARRLPARDARTARCSRVVVPTAVGARSGQSAGHFRCTRSRATLPSGPLPLRRRLRAAGDAREPHSVHPQFTYGSYIAQVGCLMAGSELSRGSSEEFGCVVLSGHGTRLGSSVVGFCREGRPCRESAMPTPR